MANYFQDPSQSFVPTPVYKPDFAALSSTLLTKQRKYDAGLASIQAAQNSVFNAPITKSENAVVRNEYLQKAAQKLKDLSEVDLSKENNAAEGRNVYSNFFKDTDIQQDMVYTKQTQDEVSKFQNFKPEKDSFEYADPRSLADMNNGIEKVRNSKRGDNSAMSVRQFVPFTDIPKWVSKQATDLKFSVETYDDKGAITQKRTNGATSIGNWTTFIDGITQDKFNAQFHVEARYAKEEGIKLAKSNYARDNAGAEITDEEAMRNLIVDNYSQNYKNHNEIFNKYAEQVTADEKMLAEFEKEHKGDADFQKKYTESQALIDQKKQTQTQYGKLRDSFDPKNPDYETHIKDFQNNPQGYFFNQIRGNTISNLAKTFAANEKVEEPKESAAYKIAYELGKDRADEARKSQEAEDKHNQFLLSAEGKWNPDGVSAGSAGAGGTGTGLNPDGTKMTAVDIEKSKLENPQYLGASNTEIKTISAAERFKTNQNRLFEAGYNPLLSPDEVGGVLADASNGSINYGEVVTYMTALNSPRSSTGQYTPEEKAIETKVNKMFADNGITLDNNNRYATGRAILALAGKHLSKAGAAEKYGTDRYANMMVSYMTAHGAIDEYNANNDLKSKQLDTLSKDPNYSRYIVDNGGKKSLIGAADLRKELGDVNVLTEVDVPGVMMVGSIAVKTNSRQYAPKKLDSVNFLESYLKGEVTIKNSGHGGDLPGGQVGMTVKTKDGEYTVMDYEQQQKLLNFQTKYGKSADLPKAVNKIDDLVTGGIPGFSGKQGQQGQMFTLPFGKDDHGTERGVRVIQQALQVGNSTVPYQDGVAMGKDFDLLKNDIATWGAETIHKNMEPPIYHTSGSTGTPSVTLKFKPMSEKDEKEMAGKYKVDVAQLRKGIELPLNPSSATDLKPLLHPSNGFYIYDRMQRGKTIEASAMEKSMDFDYSITPNDRNNPSRVKIIIKRKVFDPTTKAMIDAEPFIQDYNLGENNPDQIMAIMKKNFIQHMQSNVAAKKAADATKPTNPELEAANTKWLADFKKKNSTK